MPALHAAGRLGLQQRFVNEGIIGTRFTGRLLREERMGSQSVVVPEITGQARVTGFNQFVVDPEDPLKFGFDLSSGGAGAA